MTFITLNTIINDLLLIIRGSNVSDSETISKRQVEEWVHLYRGQLIKQDLDKGKMPNPDYIQEIDHLKLESIDTAGTNVTVNGLSAENYFLRSELEIPKTIDLNFKSGLTYVGTVDGSEIQFIPEGRSKWQSFKKYTANDAVCFIRGGYLYVMYNKPLEYITVRGIFEVPTEVSRFANSVTNQPYANLDTKYPIPANMLSALKQMILKTELGIIAQSPSDNDNDSANKLSQNIKAN